jgi:hypothetical protein
MIRSKNTTAKDSGLQDSGGGESVKENPNFKWD